MKIKEFQQVLGKREIDFALFMNIDENKRDKNIFYFAGIDPEFCCLIVPKSEEPFLIIARLEEEKTKNESYIKKIVLLEDKLFDTIKKHVGDAKNIGVNFSKFTLAEQKRLRKTFSSGKLSDISKDIIELRASKTKQEIEKIKKACQITDEIFSSIITNFKFKQEKEIADYIEMSARKRGCSLAFPSIVGSGKNSSMPHYDKNDSLLKKGFCVIDFGVRYKGYNSDMTRTIYIGNPTEKEKEEYHKVLGVQEEAIRQIKEGTDFKTIENGVIKTLGKSFIHALGHGIGIDVHDKLSTNPKKILKAGMTLAIEPGVYYPEKYGIRIEDDILVTKEGCEVLTKSSKELIVLKLKR